MADEEEQMIARAKMAEQPRPDSTPPAVNSKSKVGDSNQFNHNNDRTASPASSPKPPVSANPTANGPKAKSCTGCVYYSSRFKSVSRNPLCVGVTRSLPNVPPNLVGVSESDASKEGRRLLEFRYACVGFSVYPDRKAQPSDGPKTPAAELPFCLGLEVLVDRKVPAADSTSAPTHVHHKDNNDLPQRQAPKPSNQTDNNGLPQRQAPKPSNQTGDEFFTRFSRNANLVANGVAKNIRRVGNQIKQSLDDILYPYRRRPK